MNVENDTADLVATSCSINVLINYSVVMWDGY